MREISLASNDLSGNLPLTTGLWLPNLEELILGANKIGGQIPDSISNASKLLFLELSENLFTGSVPNSLGSLENLLLLGILDNNLTADPSTSQLGFLSSISNCKSLRQLGIGLNPFNSMFPPELNLSASLEIFDASSANIYGSTPRGFGDLTGLISLSLAHNFLTGPISEIFGKLTKLQRLYLRGNNIGGRIPNDFCHMKNLGEMTLSHNEFSGPLPGCISNLTYLKILLLDSNNISSFLPSGLWSLGDMLILNLSSNSLSGNLPLELSNLKVITQLDVSRNQFQGQIPGTIGGLQDLSILSLAQNNFEGSIPESIGGLISLQFLDLSGNNLSGTIPRSMEQLDHLAYLNLSYNELQGEIPSQGPFANFTAQSFLGNKGLCGPPRLELLHCKPSKIWKPRSSTWKVLKYTLPVLISAAALGLVILLLIYRRRARKSPPQGDELQPLATWRRITILEVQRATMGFSENNLIGTGGFGSVYRGNLSDGTTVAVKVINSQLQGASGSFDAECEVLQNIRHRNLIKIISVCNDGDFRALILEYMPNGSLEKWLHSDGEDGLEMLQRLDIMIDVASAMDYLHHGCPVPIVHCDLKPSNVLLDEKLVGRVTDFGLAKLLDNDGSKTLTRTLATIGYMAPGKYLYLSTPDSHNQT